MTDMLALVGLALGALLGLFLAANAVDTAIYAHGLLFTWNTTTGCEGRRHRLDVLGRDRVYGRPGDRRPVGLSGAEPGSAVDQFRPAAPAAHVRGDLRLRRQRSADDLVVRGPAHLPGALFGATFAPGSCSGATSCSSSSPQRATSRHHPGQGIRRAGMVRGSVADGGLGGLPGLSSVGTLWKRKEPHIYVANWFYLAFIVTIAMLHLVNNADAAGVVLRRQELHRSGPACRTP
jgi:hypothetical protein